MYPASVGALGELRFGHFERMHKPGSSDTSAGVTCAWNDIGLVVLPDGRRLAIAIFLTDSAADEATRDAVVARIARAAYDTAVETRR